MAKQVGVLGPRKDDEGNPRVKWSATPFQETAAVAILKDAVVLAGVNRAGTGEDAQVRSWICALDVEDGKELWRHALPAAPVAFGVAIDRDGRILVSLQDGRVLCFSAV